MWKIPAAFPIALVLIACAPIDEGGAPPQGGACPVESAGEWRAWMNVMPGAARTLNVAGTVISPTGGYEVRLEQGPVLRSQPQVQQVYLRADPPEGPATQAIVRHEVSASYPASGEYGAVTVLCRGQVLAEIRPVGKAH